MWEAKVPRTLRGGPDGRLGLPRTDEFGVTGGRASVFQGGSLYWSPRYDAKLVDGAIGHRYHQLGGPSSRLGVPRTDEYGVPGGRRSDFHGGSISWDGPTGEASIVYR